LEFIFILFIFYNFSILINKCNYFLFFITRTQHLYYYHRI